MSTPNYADALQQAEQVGYSRAKGLPQLAMTLRTLADVHAINPAMAYAGAVKLGLDARKVAKLKPAELGDLMFVD